MNLYFLDTKIKYVLQNNNFYAYSVINVALLKRPLKQIKKSNIFEELNKRYSSVKKDEKTDKLRDDNHKKYNSLDIDFIKKVDKRYLNKSNDILNLYSSIDSYDLLRETFNSALQSEKIINELSNKISDLKKEISKDLMSVIDYVDKKEEKINISKVLKDDSLGILITNKYHSLKLFSSKIDLDDMNFEMQHQAKRLIYIKELETLIREYQNSKTIYNNKNTSIMINNLYKIIGEYIFLLTDSEFCFTKEAIKKILSYDYDFIDQYLPTYKIILNKIWNYEIENSDGERYFYAICDINLLDNKIYMLNNYNKNFYSDRGYICEIPKEFFLNSKIDKENILKIPLPYEIKERYELQLNYNIDNLKILKIYTKTEKIEDYESLPTIFLGGD